MEGEQGVNGVELLDAAWEGRWDEALRILKAQPYLIGIKDYGGNTVIHRAAAAGNADALKQLMEMVGSEAKVVMMAKNGDGDTALHLAAKNRHQEAACFLINNAHPKAGYAKNKDGVSVLDLFREARYINPVQGFQAAVGKADAEMAVQWLALFNDIHETGTELHWAAGEGEGDNVERILAADPTLIKYRTKQGCTALHAAAMEGHVGVLRLLVRFRDREAEATDLTLERDQYGRNALHLALLKKHKSAAQYLIEVAPQAAYQVSHNDISPLHLAINNGYDDLVRLVFQLSPVSTVSPSIRDFLFTPFKESPALTALKARHLAILQVVMDNLPSLIQLLDRRGWMLLSYAAYKGYLDEVRYFLITFPKSVENYDADGSFPIHKAIAAGQVDIVKEFILHCPQTLYQVDKKGRTILHIAVQYAKVDVLSYLKMETRVEKILNVRDKQGYTFTELPEALKKH